MPRKKITCSNHGSLVMPEGRWFVVCVYCNQLIETEEEHEPLYRTGMHDSATLSGMSEVRPSLPSSPVVATEANDDHQD